MGHIRDLVPGAPVSAPLVYPATVSFLPDGEFCFAPGFTVVYPWNFCTYPGSCSYRRSFNQWEGQRGTCLSPCNTTQCPSRSASNLRWTDKNCNSTGGGSFNCANYAAVGGTCGGYNTTTLAPKAPYCDWKSVCLTNGATWTCRNSTCLNTCEYGSYCYTTNTTADNAVCGGYEVPAFNPSQFTDYLNIYIALGFHPGDHLTARKRLMSQSGASLIGPLPCTPGTSDCGLTATCTLDPSVNQYFCDSPGLFKGGVPIATQ